MGRGIGASDDLDLRSIRTDLLVPETAAVFVVHTLKIRDLRVSNTGLSAALTA
jgi:hypothetical protein